MDSDSLSPFLNVKVICLIQSNGENLIHRFDTVIHRIVFGQPGHAILIMHQHGSIGICNGELETLPEMLVAHEEGLWSLSIFRQDHYQQLFGTE